MVNYVDPIQSLLKGVLMEQIRAIQRSTWHSLQTIKARHQRACQVVLLDNVNFKNCI